MVRPADFINASYSDQIDRAILNDLYQLRNSPSPPTSAREITIRLIGPQRKNTITHEQSEIIWQY